MWYVGYFVRLSFLFYISIPPFQQHLSMRNMPTLSAKQNVDDGMYAKPGAMLLC